MISVILGPDYAMARSRMREISRQHDPSGNNTSTLDGKTVSIRQVVMDVSSVGFFSAGRVVIVEDLLARFGKQGAKDNGNTADWAGLFAAVPDANALVLIDTSLQALPAAVGRALPDSATIISCDPPRGHELLTWLQRRTTSLGSDIDHDTARFLAESLYPQTWMQKSRSAAFDRSPDTELLSNELAKLALAAHPGVITRRLVEEMIGLVPDDRIFAFLDAALAGHVSVAMIELGKLLESGEDPAKLHAQLSQNIELAAVMAAAGRRDSAEVSRDIGLSGSTRLNAIRRGLQGQSKQLTFSRVDIATSADRRMKRGELRNPLEGLYETMLAIAEARTGVVARQQPEE